MNVSSWSIRNPTPAILLFVLLTLIGVMGFRANEDPAVPGHRPADGHRSPRRCPARARRRWRPTSRASSRTRSRRCRASSTSTRWCSPARSTITVEFRLEVPTQEAVDGVRDAVSRVRSSLPGDLRDPVVSKVNLAGSPILTYTVASSRMDDEALSWFVDNTVAQAPALACAASARSSRGRRRPRGARRARPGAMLALGATAADISRQLRQTQQEASGGPRRRRRRRAVGAHHRHGPVRRGARADGHRPLRRPPRAARPDRARSSTPSPSSARRRCSTAGRWSASRS